MVRAHKIRLNSTLSASHVLRQGHRNVAPVVKGERKTVVRKTDSESIRLKLGETQSFRSGGVLLQSLARGIGGA